MKALISIPVHEKPDVILDQIENIKRFFSEAQVILHISAGFYKEFTQEKLENISGVWINPTHIETAWGDIMMPHILNFEYAYQNIDFDYFVMHSSNDLYITQGAAKYMEKYDAGFNLRFVRQQYTRWWPTALMWTDPWLRDVMNRCGQTQIVASQVEGSFYKREIMGKVIGIIRNSITAGSNLNLKDRYPREEVFFSTIAYMFVPYERIGRPYVFSEVHRFDRTLWKCLDIFDSFYKNGIKWIVPRRLYDQCMGKFNDILFRHGKYKTNAKVICKLLTNDAIYFDKNKYLNDGDGIFELYQGYNSIFAVKRINRVLEDPIRTYIRNL